MEIPVPALDVSPELPPVSASCLSEHALACLKTLAGRYVWWKTPDEAMLYPDRVAAQVMNLGDYSDVMDMIEATGEDYLRHVLRHSEIGQLNARSWHYWHYRLDLAEFGVVPVPPMPTRTR